MGLLGGGRMVRGALGVGGVSLRVPGWAGSPPRSAAAQPPRVPPQALSLCRFLGEQKLELAGRRVLELGAGTGIVGIFAAMLGAGGRPGGWGLPVGGGGTCGKGGGHPWVGGGSPFPCPVQNWKPV